MIKKVSSEFVEFLREYKIMTVAVAFIMAVASTALVKSLVDNVIMPTITPFIPGGGWREATFTMGKIVIGWGAFLGELINFVILALAVFFISKIIIREANLSKKDVSLNLH